MKMKKKHATTFHTSYTLGILSMLTYRPIHLYRLRLSYGTMAFQQQLLVKTQGYIRLFCASLLGSIFTLLLCLSPLHWVQFRVLKDSHSQELLAGLWAVCHHHLCWSHLSEAPYYLQFARAFFLISVVTILVTIACLGFYFIKGPRDKTHVDLGIFILCFISGACLFLCLLFFLMQVKLFSRDLLEPHFLLPYRLNCWASVFNIAVGCISGLSHLSSRIFSTAQNPLVIPMARPRMECMPLELNMTVAPVGASPKMPQAPEMHPWPVGPQRTRPETGMQTESDLGHESGVRYGLMA